MNWRKYAPPFFLILAMTLTIFGVIYIRAEAKQRVELESEIGKAMLSVISVALIGGIVQAVVRDLEERRKAWSTQRDLLRTDLTERVSKLYSDVKRARRLVRANTTGNKIDKSKYNELLSTINDLQLGLERHKRAAKVGAEMGKLATSTACELESMEKYLGELVTEFEQVQSRPAAESSALSLENLSQLNDFVSYSHSSRFHSSFANPYDCAMESILKQVMKDLPQVGKTR